MPRTRLPASRIVKIQTELKISFERKLHWQELSAGTLGSLAGVAAFSIGGYPT
jgi:hypothetical protein